MVTTRRVAMVTTRFVVVVTAGFIGSADPKPCDNGKACTTKGLAAPDQDCAAGISIRKRPNQEFFAEPVPNRTFNFCLPNRTELLCI